MIVDFPLYKKFVNMPSVVGHPVGNKQAIEFVSKFLEKIGFEIQVLGRADTKQPTIIARFCGRLSTRKVVIYGHYDVAPVNDDEAWISQNPFSLQNIDGRLYGRGLADNKGPLLARMLALQSLVLSNKPVPNILWLIQGEEEITQGTRVAHKIFKDEIQEFDAKLFVDETGFNDLDKNAQIAFLWSPNIAQPELASWHSLLNKSLSNPQLEYRHLNKLNGTKDCPLLANLPRNAVYMGFGPNDRLHFIHRKNESLAEHKLLKHQQQFEQFLSNYAVYNDA